ncbi:hypothetical protein MUCCIDRAFT_105456 [Mucor lusitanicus CBS 277.49]|uniref:Uncharacterized protein n=1 Tax=Mucor lusitanicus CBS 277.49 TaxID=747725 RepID=A0A162R5E0_MUCCL|nr:hypothetical protein MUCCIDRAFT_105456 [Mucor lusitanicus CBS 277.49]
MGTAGTSGSVGSNGSNGSAGFGSTDHRNALRDAGIASGSSLSAIQRSGSTGALSNDALHPGADACSDDARIDQALSDDALSMIDHDTVMDDGELLEFKFDKEIQPLSVDQQASMARDIKLLQRKLFEATGVSLLMPEDSKLASNAGSLKRQLIMAKDNYALLFGDVTEPSLAAVNSTANKLVPSDTPYIQWKGHRFNGKKYTFLTMDACFSQFQDVLESRGIEIEANWKQIIKPKMSTTGMASCTCELIAKYPAITWGQFKSSLKAKYSSSEIEEQKAFLNKLKTLKLDKCSSLETCIEKFLALKDLADVKNADTLIEYLLRGLDIELYEHVFLAVSRAPKESKTLDFAISELRSVYYLLRKDDYYRQEKQRKDDELNAKIIRHMVKSQERAEGRGSSSLSFKDHRKQTRRAGRYHVKSESKKNMGGDTLKCFNCGFTPYTYSHKAVCTKNPRNLNKGNKKKSKKSSIVPKPAVSDNDTDLSSSSDDESDLTFAVATISAKSKDKEEVVSMDTDSECKHLNKSKSGVKVNTWFLLDTGYGIIKLAQNNSVVERKGQTTEEELKINYGSKIAYSKFEVFDLFDDVHCVFGMDLLYKVGITLGNMAAYWSDRIGYYEIPDIKPNPYKPNADPYGSEEER